MNGSTIVIAVFTTVLGLFTMSLAKSTRIAADAAMRAIELAEKNERAYLFPGITNLHWNPDIKQAVFSIGISNDGQSLGLLKKIYWQFSEIEPIGDPVYIDGESRHFDLSFPAHTPNKQLPLCLQTIVGALTQYFFGYVEYIDVFKKTHTTRFCLCIAAQMPKADVAGPPAWNDWD